ncbi:MAG: diacylglycerol kinase family protein [Fodinibius sp.]|nr:diacylglycerol kinase family protein [Fodinibius sp.]
MTRYAFIYNPGARGGRSESTLHQLQQKLITLSHARLFRSQTQGDITSLVEQQRNNYDIFVACGGDGTVREVASGLVNADKKMGIIPMGTGNDLCKTLGIPTDLDKAFKLILRGNGRTIDVGRCNDNIFLNVWGCGFDGLTNRLAYQLNQLPSFLRYALGALKAQDSIARLRPKSPGMDKHRRRS